MPEVVRVTVKRYKPYREYGEPYIPPITIKDEEEFQQLLELLRRVHPE